MSTFNRCATHGGADAFLHVAYEVRFEDEVSRAISLMTKCEISYKSVEIRGWRSRIRVSLSEVLRCGLAPWRVPRIFASIIKPVMQERSQKYDTKNRPTKSSLELRYLDISWQERHELRTYLFRHQTIVAAASASCVSPSDGKILDP